VTATSRPRKHRRWVGLRRRSLRFQIVVVLVVLLTVSFAIVALVTAIALRTFLIQRLDQQLAAAGTRFSVSLEHPDDHDADNTDQLSATQGQAAGTLGARVLNGQVTAIAVIAHGDDDDQAPSTRDRQFVASLRPTNNARTINFPTLGEYRVLVTAGDDGDVLVTGLPEHPVDETITRLLLIELAVFAAALLLTGVAASLSVRWSLRPLHRVASTALEVSNLPLSTGTVTLPQRVAVDTPQTEAGQVADAFNHMLEHVESALRDRNASEDNLRHFVADASHELRTPVAVVRSQAEYAQRVGGDLPAPVTEALSRIGTEADRMGHLVDDLLLLARLDAGRPLEHSEVDLTRLVLESVSDARIISSDHVWRLDLPDHEVSIDGDVHALQQVIANLLANARTHTPPRTTVTTTLTPTETGAVTLAVHDNGPGIPADIRPRIFSRFVRAELSRARPDGTGLGLAIVSAIVTAHGGTVEVDSEPGATTFTVRLPGASDHPVRADGSESLDVPMDASGLDT
jgi:two-component system, OmpR family, sensor kinase